MTRMGALFGILAVLAATGCRTGRPLIDRTPEDQTTPGTIAGVVQTTGGDRLPGRRVEAVQAGTSRRFSAVTSVLGGFSIPVPPGKYRLEVELREGERVVREPGVLDINESDLDANLQIVIGS